MGRGRKKVNTTPNIPAKTWLITIQGKNLKNLGIDPGDWSKPEEIQRQLTEHFDIIGGKHYTAICKSADGFMHIHEAVTFDNTKRRNAVAELYGKAHSEIVFGTKSQVADYINKAGKWEEKGEEIILKWGDPEQLENNRGFRTDLKEFDKKAMKPGFNLEAFLLTINRDKDIAMYKNRFFRLKKLAAQGFRNVKVIYVEGEAGSGKTKGALDRYPGAFKASVDEKTSFPFDGYQCENVLILDELRPGVFSHAQLMQILDGYKLNINIKGGSAPACWDTVIISTAFPLAKWYDKPFDGCENYKAQLERRISAHYTAHGGKWYKYGAEFSDENIIAE